MGINLKNLIAKLNDKTRKALEGAASLCLARTHYAIEVEHFLLKLLEDTDSDVGFIVRHFELNQQRAIAEINRSLDRFKTGNATTPHFSAYVVDLLCQAWLFASIEQNQNQIRSGHVIGGLVADDRLSALVREFSQEFQVISLDRLRKELDSIVVRSAEDTLHAAESAKPETTGSLKIFLSYRRDDSSFYADYLFDKIIADIPKARVFRDSDTLKAGMVFSERIDETIAACDILLAIIGKKWAGVKRGGPRRIDDPHDWVRLEIVSALRQNKTVVPCLVGGARMPVATEIPPELEGLLSRHASKLSEEDLRRDVAKLIESLKALSRS